MRNHVLNKIKDILDAQKLKYFCDSERGAIGAQFLNCKILFDVGTESVEFREIFDKETAVERQESVREYINYVNCILKEGHLEMDGQGVVQFRIYTDISEEQDISSVRLFLLMKKASDVENAFIHHMYQVSDGVMEAKEAFDSAVETLEKK